MTNPCYFAKFFTSWSVLLIIGLASLSSYVVKADESFDKMGRMAMNLTNSGASDADGLVAETDESNAFFEFAVGPSSLQHFRMLDLQACPDTRQALAQKKFITGFHYKWTLWTLYLELKWLRIAALLLRYNEFFSITGLIPPITDPHSGKDQETYYFVQQFLELGIPRFYNLEFFSIAKDMLEFLCDDRTRITDSDPRFSKWRYYAYRTKGFFTQKELAGKNTYIDGSENRWYKVRRGNSAQKIIQLSVGLFKGLGKIFKLLEFLPFAPVRKMANSAQKVITKPAKAIEDIQESLDRKCHVVKYNGDDPPTYTKVGKVVKVLKYLQWAKSAVVYPTAAFKMLLPRLDYERLDDVYHDFLSEDGVPPCHEVHVSWKTGMSLSDQIARYDQQIEAVRGWIDELDQDKNRNLVIEEDFLADYQKQLRLVNFLEIFNGAQIQLHVKIRKLLAKAIDIDIVYELLFIDLPSRSEALAIALESFMQSINPLHSLINPLSKLNFEVLKYPFGYVADLAESAICLVVDEVGELLFDTENLCEIIESFVVGLLGDLLEYAGLTAIPSVTDLFEGFNYIDVAFDSLNVDLDGFLDIPKLLPDSVLDLDMTLADFGTFPSIRDLLDVTKFDTAMNGLFADLALTPVDILLKHSGPPQKMLAQASSGLTFESSFVQDSAVTEFTCTEGWTPVVDKAIFSTADCEEAVGPYIRFPCGDGQSNCFVDIMVYLTTCDIPESSEFYNGLLGIPVSRLSVTYYCLENVNDWKIVPEVLQGTTQIVLEPFESSLVSMEDLHGPNWQFGASPYPSDQLKYANDLFQRSEGEYKVKNIAVTPMDCSGGGQRQIEILSIDAYIDPCVNGISPIPYAHQEKRETNLCSVKLLYDEGIILGCTNQEFSDRRRMGSGSTVSISTGQTPNFQICWSNETRCTFPDTASSCEERENYSLDWEKIATNIERCEVRRRRVKYQHFGSINVEEITQSCPFNKKYDGLALGGQYCCQYRPNCVASYNPDLCPHEYVDPCYEHNGFCGSGGFDAAYCELPYEGDAYFQLIKPEWSSISLEEHFWEYTVLDCEARQALENTIEIRKFDDESWSSRNDAPDYFDNNFTNFIPSMDGGTISAYQEWQTAFESLQAECFGENGKIASCLANGTKHCDLQDIGCVPPEWLYTCTDVSTSAEVHRVYIFNRADIRKESHHVSCPSQTVSKNDHTATIDMEVNMKSVLEAKLGDGFSFTWVDITNTTRYYCGSVPLKSCEFSPEQEYMNGFPPLDTVWEIDFECLCPAGFNLLPVDGICVPCDRGYIRAPGEMLCTACPDGSVSASEGSVSCTSCPPGWYWPGIAAVGCSPCPEGTFSSKLGSTECEDCPEGTYQNMTGQASCINADAGYSPLTRGAATSQTSCEPGTFSMQGQAECSPCPPGHFSLYGSSEECDPCPLGRYAVTFGTIDCNACPQGYYANSLGASGCTECPEGLTTMGTGSTSLDQCVNIFDPSLLAQVLLDGASAEFNVEELEVVPDNGLVGHNVSVSVGCRMLLQKYLIGVDESNVEQALAEIGNGYCNFGPWNTAACGFDGGDCCPQTCTAGDYIERTSFGITNTSTDVAFLSGRCFWKNFECRDPSALAIGTGSSRCSDLARRDLHESKIGVKSKWEYLRETFLESWNGREKQRRLNIFEARVGNGVCDQDLNNDNATNNFDGGDCCPSTCIVNPAYEESCSPSTFDVPLGKSCESGYGCCDPLVLESDFSVSDVSPPVIRIAQDFSVECSSLPGYLLDSEEAPPDGVATDNDPCFNGTTAVSVSKESVPNQGTHCGGPYEKFKFHYTAQDAAGNEGTSTLNIVVRDELPPQFECPSEISISIDSSADLQDIVLPSLTSVDDCNGEIFPVHYYRSEGLILIQNNTLAWGDSLGFEIGLTLKSTDGCGNVATCHSLLVLTATAAPTNAPSQSPSDSFAPSLAPTDNPSESVQPSISPTYVVEIPVAFKVIGRAGKDPLPINLSNQNKIDMAIYSTSEFSVHDLDLTTISCGRLGYETSPSVSIDIYKDLGTSESRKKDGLVDLLFKRGVSVTDLGFDNPGELGFGEYATIIVEGQLKEGKGSVRGSFKFLPLWSTSESESESSSADSDSNKNRNNIRRRRSRSD